ncbi:hypothetical protein GXP67_19495 [Rhodocytophaga rosea]|uniref:DUF4292 domain-containing protein n=1 Tax=Rhodocytophaga rosea TaxID=2704465 RepID=A0A6C0GM13_9BACT|nr:hypothetical protein [Rhodocytophaga rosea]QHT68673.1 hypothetical protein GXP67_19495 [Rhodocytophaga rosea]
MKFFFLLLTVICYLYPATSASQTPAGIDAQDNINRLAGNDLNTIVRKFDNRYQGVIGSPFLFDQWNAGTVTLTNGKVLTNIPLKIDLYGNEIIAKRQSGDSIIIFSNSIQKVSLTENRTGREFMFEKISSINGEPPVVREGYLDVLYKGKYLLLAERRKNLIKANYSGGYNAGKPYDEFVTETDYYVKKPDQKPEKLRLTKKAILEVFPDHQQELKTFISQNQMDFKNEIQVAQVFEYYDSLSK